MARGFVEVVATGRSIDKTNPRNESLKLVHGCLSRMVNRLPTPLRLRPDDDVEG